MTMASVYVVCMTLHMQQKETLLREGVGCGDVADTNLEVWLCSSSTCTCRYVVTDHIENSLPADLFALSSLMARDFDLSCCLLLFSLIILLCRSSLSLSLARLFSTCRSRRSFCSISNLAFRACRFSYLTGERGTEVKGLNKSGAGRQVIVSTLVIIQPYLGLRCCLTGSPLPFTLWVIVATARLDKHFDQALTYS